MIHLYKVPKWAKLNYTVWEKIHRMVKLQNTSNNNSKNKEVLISKIRMVVTSGRVGEGFDLGWAQRVSGVLAMFCLLT